MGKFDLQKESYCDMVMKGGITSGVVYPLAIVKLAEKFRFKNIGGTSAGAIAAAAAAAAEFARGSGGFERLADLPDFLMKPAPDGSGSNLSALFQPQPKTSRVFRIGMAGLGGGAGAFFRVALKVLLVYWPVVILAALPGAGFLYWARGSGSGPLLTACTWVAAGLIIGAIVAALTAVFVLDLIRGLTGNGYGLCNGMTADFHDVGAAPPARRGKPLTYWLTEYLNEFAGRGPCERPLTFGDLWGSTDPKAKRNVNLEMMTTCLTHGRPYRLPFRDNDDIHENRLFYFRQDEFETLFPKNVVAWMVANPRGPRGGVQAGAAVDDSRHEDLRKLGYFPLPDPANLPVVVAVRMSLSFPVLLSAIPLHAVDYSVEWNDKTPQRCWFTDGGVCSNFPLHFFDSPLPRWPTLGIDLTQKPEGTDPLNLRTPGMPENNSDSVQESWNRFETSEKLDPVSKELISKRKGGVGKLLGFAGAFIKTMQNWTDNMQARLPGYRDRIAKVGLTPQEGGLNLDMPPGRIKDLTERGGAAGEEFIARFWEPPTHETMHWSNHRWVRLRSLLASLEALVGKFEMACNEPILPDIGYEEWVKTAGAEQAPSYKWSSPEQRQLAIDTIAALRALSRARADSGKSLALKSPRPRPELRPRPQL